MLLLVLLLLLLLLVLDVLPKALVSLVVNNITLISHKVVLFEAAGQVPPQVEGDGALRFLRFTVVLLHDGLDGLRGFLQMVVGHLGEQVMQHMGPNVMVDLVEDAVVSVNGGQPASQVAPLLHTVSTCKSCVAEQVVPDCQVRQAREACHQQMQADDIKACLR